MTKQIPGVRLEGMNPFETIIAWFREKVQEIQDPRTGKNCHYSLDDILISALAVFFVQDGSFLAFQKKMEIEYQASNMKNLFGVANIPTDDQIRNIIDNIEPIHFYSLFYRILEYLKSNNHINNFFVLDNNYIVIALDGAKYFNSKKINCQKCLVTNHSNGKVEYSHTIMASSLVSPATDVVIPLPPENNIKDDTNKKQDCEQKMIYRWLDNNIQQLKPIISDKKIIILADDLHSRDPLIDCLVEYDLNYILNCKETSHKTIYEFVEYNTPKSISYYDAIKGFKEQKLHTISWLENLPLCDGHESNRVNWISLTIEGATKTRKEIKDEINKGKKKKSFETVYEDLIFSFITNLEITNFNAKEIIAIGRARWKIENNNFHTLKHGGYKIEHNYGHGKNNLSATLIVLNLFAFLIHTTMFLSVSIWQKEYNQQANRRKFFSRLNNLLNDFLYDSFNQFLASLLQSRSPPSDENKYLINKIKQLIKVESNGKKSVLVKIVDL